MSKQTPKQKQLKVDGAMLQKALRVPHAQPEPPPPAAYKVTGVNGEDVFENCSLQFGKMPEVAGSIFIVDHANPNHILAAYASGYWSRAVIVPEADLAALKAKAAGETLPPGFVPSGEGVSGTEESQAVTP